MSASKNHAAIYFLRLDLLAAFIWYHFLFDCPVYQAQRQKLWEKLTSDPDVAAKCQILDGKSDEEKLHSMLNEEFWGVDVDEESGLVYGPFKHAFKCIAKYVAAAWKIRNAYAHPSDVA